MNENHKLYELYSTEEVLDSVNTRVGTRESCPLSGTHRSGRRQRRFLYVDRSGPEDGRLTL